MRKPMISSRFAVAGVVAVAVAAWMLPVVGARVTLPSPAAAGGAAGAEDPPVPRVYFKAPITAEEAAVWIKLQKKAPMKFEGEIPFDAFLKKIREATADKQDAEGVMIYVDPIGLQESEKTMSSTIMLNLSNVRLETALRLALKQLDMTYRVDPDGLLMITSASSNDSARDDGNSMILDRLDALQKQVAELRTHLMSPSGTAPPAK